jgi:hypothetical protein
MAVPSTRCLFKVDPDTKVGIICENTNCINYDTVNETCKSVMANQIYIDQNGLSLSNVASEINN